jgi:hypothetical protein
MYRTVYPMKGWPALCIGIMGLLGIGAAAALLSVGGPDLGWGALPGWIIGLAGVALLARAVYYQVRDVSYWIAIDDRRIFWGQSDRAKPTGGVLVADIREFKYSRPHGDYAPGLYVTTPTDFEKHLPMTYFKEPSAVEAFVEELRRRFPELRIVVK